MESRLERLRPAEIVRGMQARPLVYFPLGPLEWHGPHLPLGTDPLIAYTIALRSAEKTGGVVLPPFFWGTERQRTPQQLRDIGFKGDEWVVGMDFPANILKGLYCREEVFALLVREMLELLIAQGFQLIVFINGHGASNHCSVLDRLSAEFTARGPAKVLPLFAYSGEHGERPGVGHAGLEETSRMMAIFPQTVDLSTLPPPERPLSNVEWGIVDSLTFEGQPAKDFTVREDPRAGATPAEGENSLDRSVRAIIQQVEDALGLGAQEVHEES
jgi:creatinine amidohydrolase